CAVRQGRLGHERGRCALRRLRRRRAARPRTGARSHPARRQRLSDGGVCQYGLHQEGDDREIAPPAAGFATNRNATQEHEPMTAPALPPGTDPENALILETTPGQIVIKLRTDVAPGHAE